LECGTCVGLCPRGNIRQEQDASFRYRIRIVDPGLCESCSGVCLQVCPGHAVDVDALNQQVFGRIPGRMPGRVPRDRLTEDYLAGNYRHADGRSLSALGYATDAAVRERASSGGIVSALLIHALESGLIDGVFLVCNVPGKPFSPSFDLVADRDGVLAAAGSKYWPAPVGRCLGDILRGPGLYAFVGTPCQIQALRKAETVYKALKRKSAFRIGLFCGRRATVQGQLFTLRQFGVDVEDVLEMSYRQGAWPGHLVIRLRNGEHLDVPRAQQLPGFSGHLFPHPRCVLCHDSIAELADISVGDSLRLEEERRENEFSLVVARTEAGVDVLQAAEAAGAIHLRPVDIGAVVHSQKRPLLDKRRALWARIRLARAMPGLPVPEIRLSRPPGFDPMPADYLRGLSLLLIAHLTQHAVFRAFLQRLPWRWLQRYSTFKG
jgi:coenzyme F420 hydrogenase subunit beta